MSVLNQILGQVAPLAVDLFRLCIWLVLLGAILIPLERLWPARRDKLLRKDVGVDLTYYFLNNYLPKLLLIPPIALLGWCLHFLVPAQLYAATGHLPLGVRLAAAFVLGDLGYYWFHRLSHEIPFLWRFHAVHHSAEHVDWLISARAHPLDVAFAHFGGLVPLYALGFTQPMTQQTDIAPLLFVIVGTTWGYFIHANLRWRMGWFEYVLSTPGFHHWHHTKLAPINRNYASMIPALDMMFGTFFLPKTLPEAYGIEAPMPPALLDQLVEPFTPLPATSSLPGE